MQPLPLRLRSKKLKESGCTDTSQHFEDVLGAKAGPLRAQAGLTHAAELLGGVEEALSSTWAAGTSNGFGSGVEKRTAEADEVSFSGVVAGVVEQLLARR